MWAVSQQQCLYYCYLFTHTLHIHLYLEVIQVSPHTTHMYISLNKISAWRNRSYCEALQSANIQQFIIVCIVLMVWCVCIFVYCFYRRACISCMWAGGCPPSRLSTMDDYVSCSYTIVSPVCCSLSESADMFDCSMCWCRPTYNMSQVSFSILHLIVSYTVWYVVVWHVVWYVPWHVIQDMW